MCYNLIYEKTGKEEDNMKKFTKILGASVVATMLVTGCASAESKQSGATEIDVDNIITSDAKVEEVMTAEPSETSQSEESTQISTESSEAANDIWNIPSIKIIQNTDIGYDETGEVELVRADYNSVSAEGEGFESLNAVLSDRWPGAIEGDMYTEDLYEEAKSAYEMMDKESEMYFNAYSTSEILEIMRVDSSVVSLQATNSDYMGGAHGNYVIFGYTFDTSTGALLTLEDVVNMSDEFKQKASDFIIEKLGEEYKGGINSDYAQYIPTTFDTVENILWYLDASGIAILYSPYEIGPYAMGAPKVILPYTEFKEYINPKYLPTEGAMVTKIPENTDISYLLGVNEEVKVDVNMNEYEMNEVSIVSGMDIKEMGSYGYYGNAYLIKRPDKRAFILIECDCMSDDYELGVYEITEGIIREVQILKDTTVNSSCISVDKICMDVRLDVLGSYSGEMLYQMDENGQLSLIEDVYKIESYFKMTVMKELPVTIDGNSTTLAPGTTIMITGTNNKDTAYFKQVGTQENIEGAISYTLDEDGWTHYIDGVSEYDYFDMVPYAG